MGCSELKLCGKNNDARRIKVKYCWNLNFSLWNNHVVLMEFGLAPGGTCLQNKKKKKNIYIYIHTHI